MCIILPTFAFSTTTTKQQKNREKLENISHFVCWYMKQKWCSFYHGGTETQNSKDYRGATSWCFTRLTANERAKGLNVTCTWNENATFGKLYYIHEAFFSLLLSCYSQRHSLVVYDLCSDQRSTAAPRIIIPTKCSRFHERRHPADVSFIFSFFFFHDFYYNKFKFFLWQLNNLWQTKKNKIK